ncbi:MAG: hypothetical protein OXB92_16385 [Acidimicrobiaceae bacterium]|nr:hypothetical protein [Acidimicrobiia bacterium]MCY4495424.1 hypothetical protein [Acidimicrobiaceae bacterium]
MTGAQGTSAAARPRTRLRHCQQQVAAVPPPLKENVLLGAANCPEDAITVIDDD